MDKSVKKTSEVEQSQVLSSITSAPTGKWAYISLIYSLFYFFPIALNWQQISTGQLLISVAIYAVFIALFIQALHKFGRQAYLPILAIIVLATLGSSINPGCNTLFGFAAFLSSYYFSLRNALLMLILNLAAQFTAALSFDLFALYFLAPSLIVSLCLAIYGRFSQKDYFHQLRVNEKNSQIEQLAAIAERERIARDMHDLLGHSLSSLALKSELAEKLIKKGKIQLAQQEISQVAEVARQTLSEVREAVTGLNQQSLVANIEKLSQQLRHLGYSTITDIQVSQLSAKVESCLNMLAKEWITNILRHSKADAVTIALTNGANRIRLVITDNGDVKQLVPGNGIAGMRARVGELQGELKIALTSGVQLDVSLPINDERTP